MNRKSGFGLYAFATLLAIAGCSKPEEPPPQPAPKVEGEAIIFPADSPQVKALTAEPAATRPAPPRTVNGRLVWDEDTTVRIFSPFAGSVQKILVRSGDRVTSGQALAILASPDFGQAQADTSSAESAFQLAEKNLGRTRELVDNGVAPGKELNAAEAEFSHAQAELARARARTRLYGGSRTINQQFTLKTPVAGVVVERNINPGQELRPDQNAQGANALFVVTNPRALWAILDVQEEDLPRIGIGETVAVRSPAYPEERFDAKITAVADFLDPVSRTIKVRTTLDNTHLKLKAEMFVIAELSGSAAPQILVPTRAVFFANARHYAFTDDGNGRYTRHEVKIGDTDRDQVRVISGLAEGQRVVVDGALALQQIVAPRRVKN